MKILSRLAVSTLALGLMASGTTAAHAETARPAEGVSVESGSVAVQPGTSGATTRSEGRSLVVESNWTYGTKPRLYSNYFHRTRWHGSSVKTATGVISRSPNTQPGAWSYAFGKSTPGRVDYAYYRITS